MFLDSKARPWIVSVVVIAISLTLFWFLVNFSYRFEDWPYRRLFYTLLGVGSLSSILFCSALRWIKLLPNKMKFRKVVQPVLDEGHPWVGLLSGMIAMLHTNFLIPKMVNVHTTLYVVFALIYAFGLLFYHFHHTQIMNKDAKGTAKKEMAGKFNTYGYMVAKVIHEPLHYVLYVLLALHVYSFFWYAKLW